MRRASKRLDASPYQRDCNNHYSMSIQISTLELPEWSFLGPVDGDGDSERLVSRDVMIHTRTATVMEFFEADKFAPAPRVRCEYFTHHNTLGIDERHVCVLHYSATLEYHGDDVLTVMQAAIEEYCEWMDYEDKRAERDANSMFN